MVRLFMDMHINRGRRKILPQRLGESLLGRKGVDVPFKAVGVKVIFDSKDLLIHSNPLLVRLKKQFLR
ncbi:hypothetical protein KIH39_18520 [Telmatocola sphagniphila]|uniref:Uncharacterized protein n=1 Tax=Telmatocola sphagniphila TaxID=1123043 RepID=A0A8E6EU56_9BACT|nr:hypothetical protein [Telmatocola sphagniphila]QVL30832.1 hypothetical protein KIH39_18520 [Telmatocola sphagniphila]